MKGHGKAFSILFAFLIACGSSSSEQERGGNRAEEEKGTEKRTQKGRELYVDNCGSCHQGDGSGVPNMYPPLRGTERVKGPPEKLIPIVLEGIEGKIEVKGKTYDRNMPAQSQLSDQEIAQILTYIRREFGDGAGSISPEQVAELREKGESE